jgi:hypothetical protein
MIVNRIHTPIQVTWYKDGREIDTSRCQTTFSHGVCTLEIYNTRMDDAGRYSCTAINALGEDETVAMLSIQDRRGRAIEPVLPQGPYTHIGGAKPTSARRVYDTLNVAGGAGVAKSASSSDTRTGRHQSVASTSRDGRLAVPERARGTDSTFVVTRNIYVCVQMILSLPRRPPLARPRSRASLTT